MTVKVIDESRETRLDAKRARMRRRSFFGSLTFHSMTRGVTIKGMSAERSKTTADNQATTRPPGCLKQLLRLKFRSYHAPSVVLHAKAVARSIAT